MSNTDPNAEQPTPEVPAAPEAPAQPYAPPAPMGAPVPDAAPAAPPVPPAPPAAPAAPQYAPPAQQYAAPAPQYGAAPAAAPTNTLAIISMISSIVGIFSWGILSILGIILGHISLKQIKQRGEGGRGMALTGLIVGYIGIAIYVVITLILVIGLFMVAAAGGMSYSY